jgi:prephenate dehydrogenase
MNSPASTDDLQFEAIAIVGVGLIGGSIAAALKKQEHCPWIIGVGRNADKLQPALSRGLLDEIQTDVASAAAEADLIVVCTPVDRITEGVRAAAQSCAPGALITDAGSVKGDICRELQGTLPDEVAFIGSHPLAGSEKSGFEHADPELFAGRVCVITPVADSPRPAVARVTRFWQSLGMTVIRKSPADHDRLLAITSHVPHLVAVALAMLLDENTQPFAASGFRDTTRIAASDPELWTAIVRANTDAVIAGLDRFRSGLQELRDAIAAADWPRLQNLLQTAKTKRNSLEE